jgi:glucose-6-phosphate 1-dehydrogenase
MSAPELTTRSYALEARSEPQAHTAYAHLILQMLRERPMLFVRGDEAEEAWRITDPVARAWAEDVVPMTEYPAGTSPPDVAGPPRSAGRA